MLQNRDEADAGKTGVIRHSPTHSRRHCTISPPSMNKTKHLPSGAVPGLEGAVAVVTVKLGFFNPRVTSTSLLPMRGRRGNVFEEEELNNEKVDAIMTCFFQSNGKKVTNKLNLQNNSFEIGHSGVRL